ncbi:hypothetical protein RhiirA4_446064 [Rhizophagus irregularis]|uniref:Ion transport domain-containing protein n=1 Tax=Rhizophagus irregularis TaxID=588596 RepID=A0A2I1GTC6_9GLOM|nr:hypothetical protein RhiirA4_446064 [Rhizophagus irregularis]
MNDAAINIDEIDDDKIDINNDIDKPHNNKPITRIGVSPNGKYYVTYREDGNGSIIGWNIKSIDENDELGPGFKLSKTSTFGYLYQICVSDYKELAYINESRNIEIYDMLNDEQKIKLDCGHLFSKYGYSTFNLKGEFILYEMDDNIIFVYSTQTKINKLKCKKWKCERMYKIPKNFELISISKYDKLYLFSNNSIYVWDLVTEKGTKICGFDEEIKYTFYSESNIRISSNEEFICIGINNKIIIYSIELKILIASLDINEDIHLHNFSHTTLIPLLISLLNGSTIMKHCWNEFLDRLKGKSQLSIEYQTDESFPDNFHVTSEYAIRILDGHVWKIKLEEILVKMNLTSGNPDEIVESWYFNDETYETYDHLNFNLLNSHLVTVRELFKDNIDKSKLHIQQEWPSNLIKWTIYIRNGTFRLQVFKNNGDFICEKVESWDYSLSLIESKLHNDSDIIVLATNGLYIYHLDEINKSISLNYYYYMKTKKLKNYIRFFSGPTLPLPNYESFKLNDKWVLRVKDNKESLLKYGIELLTFAIEDHRLDLIDDIYKKCIDYFKEDLRNNRMFLSIITSTMPLLNEYYPEYISRYSSETIMIIDSALYSTKYLNNNLHLHSFQYLQIVNLTKSIWWTKYNCLIMNLKKYWKFHSILIIIQFLILLPLLPIYFVIFYILSSHNLINDIKKSDMFSVYFLIIDKISLKISKYSKYTTPMFTFMNPYIKFVNYPQNYNWFLELIMPHYSPFVKTISRDIYKTWSGETLINFKWNKYGKYYYSIIWIGFMFLLGCFTAAATIPQQYINDDIQKQLLIASIILGFIHLSFEIRQIIYNPIKWISDIWNIFEPNFSFGEYTNNNDPNNPWNLATAYHQVFGNGTVDPNPFMIQPPDENTNMFEDFGTFIFAMYLFLTGNLNVEKFEIFFLNVSVINWL